MKADELHRKFEASEDVVFDVEGGTHGNLIMMHSHHDAMTSRR